MLGREFNYFFQGIVFSIFNFRKSSMHSIMWSWKGHYVAPEWAGGEGAWYTPSDNDYFMADAGYDASPKLWAQYVARMQTYIRQHPKVTMFKPYPAK
jgi:hypothetical protein